MMGYKKSLKHHFLFSIGLIALMFIGCSRQPKAPSLPSLHDVMAQAASDACFDTNPQQQKFSYLYAPGFTGTEAVMGRYCPHFTASTGEKVSWDEAGHVIGQPHSSVVFCEIDLHKPNGFTLNPINAFINNVRKDLFPTAKRFFQDMFKVTVEDNPKSSKSVINYTLSLSNANVGQEQDIHRLYKAYKKHLVKHPDTNLILYGDSRGASTNFNFIALHNPPMVKAAVLEGIFDSLPHIIKHFMYIDKETCTETRLNKLTELVLGGYNKKARSPRDYAEIIHDDIPLLFVTSLNDSLCSPQGAMYLYNRLRERGHKRIHLLVLKNADHPRYMIHNPEDTKLYETVVHAFYKNYDLPHNNIKANAGKAMFDKTQPSATELKKMYNLPTCCICYEA